MKNMVIEYNMLKRYELINKIIKCDGNFRLFCIDVDGVIFNVESHTQELLEKIDHRATQQYRNEISREETIDLIPMNDESFAILNAILEEFPYPDYDEDTDRVTMRNYPKIDYDEMYQDKYLISRSVELMRYILENRRTNDFYIFLSHRNPEREAITKMKRLYELFPNIDAIETLPFHIEVGSKIINSKANYIKEIYGLPSLENCILIDDSRTNGKDFRRQGGTDIRFLLNGFGNNQKLSDHLARITELDPYRIQLALTYIKLVRMYPDRVEEINNFIRETVPKIKVKHI